VAVFTLGGYGLLYSQVYLRLSRKEQWTNMERGAEIENSNMNFHEEIYHYNHITYCLIHMAFSQLTEAYSFSLTLFPLSVHHLIPRSTFCIHLGLQHMCHWMQQSRGYKLANNRPESGRSCYLLVNHLNYQFLLQCYCVPLAPIVRHAT
jgi:hypothetical protein